MIDNDELNIAESFIGRDKKTVIFILTGSIDTNTSIILKEKLLFLSNHVNRYVLDFGNVDYVSSAGWGVILSRLRDTRQNGGDIILVNMKKEVYSIYDLLELNKVIKYFTATEEALEFFGEKPAAAAVIPHVQEPVQVVSKPSRRPLTLDQALRRIIRKNPLLNSSGIKKVLELPEYGLTGFSVIKVYFRLRKLGLNTRAGKLYYAWQEEKRSKTGE
ncbi:anti-sigma factor antagonist [candidate division WOR-3 bacterium]|nr:anti-sigma factor antagonist [candidate division WOR-3 bacterium]